MPALGIAPVRVLALLQAFLVFLADVLAWRGHQRGVDGLPTTGDVVMALQLRIHALQQCRSTGDSNALGKAPDGVAIGDRSLSLAAGKSADRSCDRATGIPSARPRGCTGASKPARAPSLRWGRQAVRPCGHRPGKQDHQPARPAQRSRCAGQWSAAGRRLRRSCACAKHRQRGRTSGRCGV